MAIRTTPDEVRLIMEETTITDAVIDKFILGASALVDNVLGSDTTLSATLKEEIETWLTAHMIASTLERMPAKMGGGPSPEITYTGRWDKGLDSTPYGQQVMTLDPTGKMKATSESSGTFLRAVRSFS